MIMPPGSFSPVTSGSCPVASPIVALSPAIQAPLTTGQVEPSSTEPVWLRVLHLVNGEHFAGAERVQSHLGRCLPRHGIEADFACLKPGRFAEAAAAAGEAWGRTFAFPMRNRFDLSLVPSISKLVRAGNYGLLHAHTPRSALIASLVSRQTHLPWVYHVHSPASRDSAKPLRNWLNDKLERLSFGTCSHLITVSDSLRRELLASGIRRGRVTVVRNGVPAIRHERDQFPQVGGQWRFGMVALMRPRKGLEVALQAIAILRSQGHDAKLRCIGPFETDDYRRAIESQIETLGIRPYVETLGFKSDVPQALSQLDAMLLPSLYGEGLPMVVLEAMASALPVIATRVEGTPEAIRDSLDGLLAEPGSADSLAAQMRKLITGAADWHALAQSAFQRHAEMFSDVAMSAGVADVYRAVLAPAVQ